MTLHPRPILWGAIAGLLGGAASCGLIAGMGLMAGSVPAVLAATVAGASGALIAARGNFRQAAAVLESLAEVDLMADGHPGPLVLLGHGQFDAGAARLRGVLDRAKQLEVELSKAERMAKSFWVSMNRAAQTNSGVALT